MANLINEDDEVYKVALQQIIKVKENPTFNAPIVSQDDVDYSLVNINQLQGSEDIAYTSSLVDYAYTSSLADYAYISALNDYAYTSSLSNYLLSSSDLSSLSGVLSLSSGGTGNTTFSDGAVIIVSGTNFIGLERPDAASILAFDGTSYSWVAPVASVSSTLTWDGSQFLWA